MDPTTGYFKDIYEYYNDNVYLPEHNLSYAHNEILEDLRPEPQHEEGNIQNYWDIWNVRNEEKGFYELLHKMILMINGKISGMIYHKKSKKNWKN